MRYTRILEGTMTDNYIPVAMYQGQQVYYDIFNNKVYIEKDHSRLVSPSIEDKKGLIESGIVKIVNGIIAEINIPKGDLTE
jgi:hypothetical protein